MSLLQHLPEVVLEKCVVGKLHRKRCEEERWRNKVQIPRGSGLRAPTVREYSRTEECCIVVPNISGLRFMMQKVITHLPEEGVTCMHYDWYAMVMNSVHPDVVSRLYVGDTEPIVPLAEPLVEVYRYHVLLFYSLPFP